MSTWNDSQKYAKFSIWNVKSFSDLFVVSSFLTTFFKNSILMKTNFKSDSNVIQIKISITTFDGILPKF